MQDIPPALTVRPFTVVEAHAAGLSDRVLAGARFVRLLHGVYSVVTLPLSPRVWIQAASMAVSGAFASHVTGLQWHGIDLGPARPFHFSTDRRDRSRVAGIVVHRYEALPPVLDITLTPEACWLGAALQLNSTALVIAGDALIHRKLTTLNRLWNFIDESHGVHGVKRARTALLMVREGAESPRESVLRLILVGAGLPEPECNTDILDGARFLGRGDLVYRDHRVLVEYDGRQHWTDHRQWERDVIRLEELARAGWIVIRVTNDQMARPAAIVERVAAALRSRGYRTTDSGR